MPRSVSYSVGFLALITIAMIAEFILVSSAVLSIYMASTSIERLPKYITQGDVEGGYIVTRSDRDASYLYTISITNRNPGWVDVAILMIAYDSMTRSLYWFYANPYKMLYAHPNGSILPSPPEYAGIKYLDFAKTYGVTIKPWSSLTMSYWSQADITKIYACTVMGCVELYRAKELQVVEPLPLGILKREPPIPPPSLGIYVQGAKYTSYGINAEISPASIPSGPLQALSTMISILPGILRFGFNMQVPGCVGCGNAMIQLPIKYLACSSNPYFSTTIRVPMDPSTETYVGSLSSYPNIFWPRNDSYGDVFMISYADFRFISQRIYDQIPGLVFIGGSAYYVNGGIPIPVLQDRVGVEDSVMEMIIGDMSEYNCYGYELVYRFVVMYPDGMYSYLRHKYGDIDPNIYLYYTYIASLSYLEYIPSYLRLQNSFRIEDMWVRVTIYNLDGSRNKTYSSAPTYGIYGIDGRDPNEYYSIAKNLCSNPIPWGGNARYCFRGDRVEGAFGPIDSRNVRKIEVEVHYIKIGPRSSHQWTCSLLIACVRDQYISNNFEPPTPNIFFYMSTATRYNNS